MAKVQQEVIDEMEEMMSYGCDWAGTEEKVTDIAHDILAAHGNPSLALDEAVIVNEDDSTVCVLSEFVEEMFTKVAEMFINALKTAE